MRHAWTGPVGPAPVRGGLVGAAPPTSGCVGAGMPDMPGTGSVEREQAADGRSGVAQRGRGLGPVAVTSRCGTQSSTWWTPSNVAPFSSITARSERRWNFTWVKSSNRT